MTYYFDIDDGVTFHRDEFGDAVREDELVGLVRSILLDLMRDSEPGAAVGTLTCRVRDDDGREVYAASLSFTEAGLPSLQGPALRGPDAAATVARHEAP